MSDLSPIGELEEGEILESPIKSKYEVSWRARSPASPKRHTRFELYPYLSYKRHTRTEGYQSYDQKARVEPVPYTRRAGYESGTKFDSRTTSGLRRTFGPAGYPRYKREIKMTAESYADSVSRLRDRKIMRQVGRGTLEDPLLMWICRPIDNPTGYVEGVEKLCREACQVMGTTKLWVRKNDHNTTRTFSRTATGRTEQEISRDDPHITAYMGDSEEYDYEGHVYCGYSEDNPIIPARFALPEERRFDKSGKRDPICLLDRRELRKKAYRLGFLPLNAGKSHPKSRGYANHITDPNTGPERTRYTKRP